MRELWQEILASMSRNKLRTFLTGFSVAWGIFMLVMLLGSGMGLQHGVTSNFEDMATNSVNLYAGQTSKAYKGYQEGRRIRMTSEDFDAIKKEFPFADNFSGRLAQWSKIISHGKKYTSVSMFGVGPSYAKTDGVKITDGRFINASDIREERKVAVIDRNTAKVFFGELGKPIGKTIRIDQGTYTVVGVYKMGMGNRTSMYIPASTMQRIYAPDGKLNEAVFTIDGLDTREKNEAFNAGLRATLGAQHTFAPDDQSAVYISNNQLNFMEILLVFNGIQIFIWIIGIGTLMAGIVGVSNIMLVTVRERTNEFGVRKSLGARPGSIVRLVLAESILITALFGYIGMVLGVGVMELVNFFIERQLAAAAELPNENGIPVIFKDPTVNLSIAIGATVLLIVAGMIAGYVPARRAANIKTIDALRHNK